MRAGRARRTYPSRRAWTPTPAVGKVGEIFAATWMKPTVGFAPLMADGETASASANGAGAVATLGAPADGRQSAPTQPS